LRKLILSPYRPQHFLPLNLSIFSVHSKPQSEQHQNKQKSKNKQDLPAWLLQKGKPSALKSNFRFFNSHEKPPNRLAKFEHPQSMKENHTKHKRRVSDIPISNVLNDDSSICNSQILQEQQNERYIEFFKESLYKFKQEKQADITSELFVSFINSE